MGYKNKVKYFPITDLSYGYFLNNAVEETIKILNKKEYNLIDILNLYETNLYLNDYCRINQEGRKILDKIIIYKLQINEILGKYFLELNEHNFIERIEEIIDEKDLINVFLRCFEHYKVFNKISDELFEAFMDKNKLFLDEIFHFKKIVRKYERVIKLKLLEIPNTAELFVKKYDYKLEEDIHIPLFTNEEKEIIFSNYILYKGANLNYLRTIDSHIDNGDTYKLKPKQRMDLKKAIEKNNLMLCKEAFFYNHKTKVIIDREKDDFVAPYNENNEIVYTLPGKWIDENLDYATLLNNFIYILNYCDFDMNFTHLSNLKNETIVDRFLTYKSSTNYVSGFIFQLVEIYKELSFYVYINYLQHNHDICIEDIIEWFFNVYLEKEFSIKNFNVSLSKDKKIINRCKVLFPEFDSILKKYRIYVEYGEINNAYLKATREILKIDDCPSLIKNKYLIINKENNDIKSILNLLFSDQSGITYINANLKSTSFINLILTKNINIQDFKIDSFQLRSVKFLLEKEIIFLDENNIIKLQESAVAICKYLYENNFLKNHNFGIEKEFIKKGYLIPYTRLFAPEEADYLNYYLNNSKFGDAKALSNVYRHGDTTSEDEQQIYIDYLSGLRILILIMIKINNELCIISNVKNEKLKHET